MSYQIYQTSIRNERAKEQTNLMSILILSAFYHIRIRLQGAIRKGPIMNILIPPNLEKPLLSLGGNRTLPSIRRGSATIKWQML